MSYDIAFKVKVEGLDRYATVGDCTASITCGARKIIELSTGLPLLSKGNNGFCKDVIPYIVHGLVELDEEPVKYKPYEDESEWVTVECAKCFLNRILSDWQSFREEYGDDIADVTTFWVE